VTFELIKRTIGRRKKNNDGLRTLVSAPPNRSEESWGNFLREDLSQKRKALVLSTLRLVEATGSASYPDSISASLEITGKRLLEVGSHYCWYAPFFLKAGCLSYHGTDLEFDRGHRQISGPHGAAESPMTFADFIDSFCALTMTDCDIRDLPPAQDGFDAAFMTSTSEHFDDPHGCFAAIASLLTPDGRIFVNHHNYYSWNGHHRAPWRVQDIDPNSPVHRSNSDWAHLRNRVRNPDSPNYLNYIRMHELIDIMSEFFIIEDKRTVRFGPDTGEGRLTLSILDEFPRYYREELETLELHLRARRRTGGVFLPSQLGDPGQHRCSIEIGWQQREIGHAFITRIPSIGKLNGLTLIEDDALLGPGAAMHDQIRNVGAGAYSVWGNYLYFSTSDNTDPAVNRRKYVLRSR
jgi:SAM-dependent methyltransferase